MKKTFIWLALATCLQGQAAFSQKWVWNTSRPWPPEHAMAAGAVVAVFSNIYCDQAKKPWYWRILIPMILGLGYEVVRWAEGKTPLGLNGVYAGVGASAYTFTIKVVF